MENQKIRIAILGGGISGLATAFILSKNENYDVTVYEKNEKPGGSMTTERVTDFLLDFGPNSGLETTPLIREMVEEIGLGDEMIYANEVANKRYILRNNKLLALPTGPSDFIKSPLFSLKGKLRLMAEIFIPRDMSGKKESVYDFVKRRLGKEFADYAIDPFVSGVYAGNPHELCVESAFNKVYALEQKYGGLIKGMIFGAKERKKRKETSKNYAKMFSFINGMQSFPEALTKYLGTRVKLGTKVEKVIKIETGYRVLFTDGKVQGDQDADIVISTLPAFLVPNIIDEIETTIENDLEAVQYPQVKVMFVVFRKDQIKRPLDGFGFLIPSLERKRFLGAIWSSTIFPNRSSDEYAAFTLFVGGSRKSPEEKLDDIEKEKLVLAEFKEIMEIEGPFTYLKSKIWDKAIPQYVLGYHETEETFKYFEEMHKGIILAGNYRGGISVGDCVKSSITIQERVDRLVKEKYVPQMFKIKNKDITNWKEGVLWDSIRKKD